MRPIGFIPMGRFCLDQKHYPLPYPVIIAATKGEPQAMNIRDLYEMAVAENDDATLEELERESLGIEKGVEGLEFRRLIQLIVSKYLHR